MPKAPHQPSAKKAVLLRLPPEILEHIEDLAKAHGFSREYTLRLAAAGVDESTMQRGFAKLAKMTP